MAVALLAGAMVGVFWVLFADFMKKRRELEMSEKTETSSQEVEQNLQNLIDKRTEFYKFLDENIEKIPNCDAYDFKDDEKMKKLSVEAKILYGILLDRMSLSILHLHTSW